MNGMLSLDQLRQHVAEGTIDTVLVCQVDMQGRLMGKRFHADFFLQSATYETHSCNYLLATDIEMETVPGYKSSSWEAGYGDYTMKPDLGTLRRIPWLEGTALVLSDVQDHATHRDVTHSPRAVLKAQLARLEAMGLTAMMASELEFFLFKTSYEEAHEAHYRNLAPISPYNEDYHIFQTTKEEDLMRAIRNGLNDAGIPVECSKGEAGIGQEEINICYADALTMADRHSILKNSCKEIAWQRGKSLTFMAKWDTDHAGNSAHVHQSIWRTDGGGSSFHDPNAEHGMSDLMRHYLAGLLKHADEITYFLAPFVNSYKRYQAGTFAPTAAVWSMDNRTAGFRVCGENSPAVRIECRIGGADLNPYLAFAAMLAAGIDGVENRLPLEEAYRGDAYQADETRQIPTTLRQATANLEGSAMLRAAFGDDVVEHYVRAGTWEQAECDRLVSDVDLIRGFERT